VTLSAHPAYDVRMSHDPHIPNAEDTATAELEQALQQLAAVDVPDDLKPNIMAKVAGDDFLPMGSVLGLRRGQWVWAGVSLGAWLLLTQGVFSWMLGGWSSL